MNTTLAIETHATNTCNTPHPTQLKEFLMEIKDNHKIWKNPLLKACNNGTLNQEDFKFIFSQYYFYSKNFTKLLAAGFIHCDNDYFRSLLSKNLWEEGGGLDIELRHAELYRKFLTETLSLVPDKIIFEPCAEYFFKQYLDLCLNTSASKCMAILSFATEGIVSRLYGIFKTGLLAANLSENIEFFNIHIACDDEHALTLEAMALSFAHEPNWLESSKLAIIEALDLRDTLFTRLYEIIQHSKFNSLIARVSTREIPADITILNSPKFNIHDITGEILYQNENLGKNIKFSVDRVPFDGDVLDPRLVTIPVGYDNEMHSHAHETVFLILAGTGEVIVGKNITPVMAGDMVFVPRWINHQTRNTGNEALKFFAVTDYGLTKRLPQNSENCYRLKSLARA